MQFQWNRRGCRHAIFIVLSLFLLASAAQATSPGPETLVGRLEVWLDDRPAEHRSSLRYFLRNDREMIELLLSNAHNVRGRRTGDRIRVLAPHAKIRPQIVPPPSPVSAPAVDPEKPISSSPERPKRWAELLARVFGFDLSACPDCGGPLKIIAAILEPHAIKSILTHLRIPDKPPDLAPEHIPEQTQFA